MVRYEADSFDYEIPSSGERKSPICKMLETDAIEFYNRFGCKAVGRNHYQAQARHKSDFLPAHRVLQVCFSFLPLRITKARQFGFIKFRGFI